MKAIEATKVGGPHTFPWHRHDLLGRYGGLARPPTWRGEAAQQAEPQGEAQVASRHRRAMPGSD